MMLFGLLGFCWRISPSRTTLPILPRQKLWDVQWNGTEGISSSTAGAEFVAVGHKDISRPSHPSQDPPHRACPELMGATNHKTMEYPELEGPTRTMEPNSRSQPLIPALRLLPGISGLAQAAGSQPSGTVWEQP